MSLITSLLSRLELPLPGEIAHAKMAHIARGSVVPAPDHAKLASVLILLYEKENQWFTTLMKRTSKFKNDKHKGQISFPGGQSEPTDSSKADTALRENEEEMGISASNIKILGPLTELYIPVSNFLVQPYIGYLNTSPIFKPDTNEVDEVIEVPLSILTNQYNKKNTSIKITSEIILQDVPYFDVHGHIVWGATSMIISEFVDVLSEAGIHSYNPS